MTFWKKQPWQRRPGTFSDRIVPRRLDITGDVVAGKLLIGRGNAELNILEQQMSFQGLSQGGRTVKLDGGAVIQCWSAFNLKQVNIYVPPQRGGLETHKKVRKCFCTCHLASGKIVNYTRYACYDFMSPTTVYDVEVCHSGNPYIYTLLSGVRPMLPVPYYNEQKVLVVFEPDNVSDPYIPTLAQGCGMIRCRLTDISHIERYFWEDTIY